METQILLNGVHNHYDKEGITYVDDITGTVGLIKMEGKNILIDCGSVFYEKELISALKDNSLELGDIDFIIFTHSHLDHIGNFHLFRQAKLIDAPTMIDLENKIYTKYPQNSDLPLPKGIEIMNTPGHVLPHFSILVKKDGKNIIFSGDAINVAMLESDYKPAGQDISKMTESALKICQIADEIIPGHGDIVKGEEIGKIKNKLLKLKQGEVA